MTKTEIDGVLDRVRSWPDERRAEAAEILLYLEARDTDVYVLSEEDERALAEAEAEADRGEFASDEEVAALFAKYRG